MISAGHLSRFVDSLERKTATDRFDAIANAVQENGGRFEFGDPDDTTAIFEISLHGILAWGRGATDATDNWISEATRRIEDLEDAA